MGKGTWALSWTVGIGSWHMSDMSDMKDVSGVSGVEWLVVAIGLVVGEQLWV